MLANTIRLVSAALTNEQLCLRFKATLLPLASRDEAREKLRTSAIIVRLQFPALIAPSSEKPKANILIITRSIHLRVLGNTRNGSFKRLPLCKQSLNIFRAQYSYLWRRFRTRSDPRGIGNKTGK